MNLDNLKKMREERDRTYDLFISESTKAAKHNLNAQAARASYRLLRAEVTELERDFEIELL